MMRLIQAGFAICLLSLTTPAQAQEGCTAVQTSCTQMNARCENNCKNANNASACVARICSNALNACKANGVWKPPGGAACWRTSNRS